MKVSDLLVKALEKCFEAGGVHLVEVPVDYSDNNRILNHEIAEKAKALESLGQR